MTSGAIREIGRATALGFSWRSQPEPRLEVRFFRRGRWDSWGAVPGLGDHRPDIGDSRAATAAVWIGDAEAFELRSDRHIGGLIAHLVAAGSDPLQRRQATPVDGAPPYTSRAAWGATRPRVAPSYGEVNLVFVHHTVGSNSYRAEESAALVRSIQHYHRNVLGWNDIGYNALVDRFGQIFEGRAGGLDRAVIGAHAQGWNSLSSGIALIGTHTSAAPSAAAFDALAEIVAYKLNVHGIPTRGKVRLKSLGGEQNRYPAGTKVRLPRIAGHRHGGRTECPGDAMQRELKDLRARVDQLLG